MEKMSSITRVRHMGTEKTGWSRDNGWYSYKITTKGKYEQLIVLKKVSTSAELIIESLHHKKFLFDIVHFLKCTRVHYVLIILSIPILI
jgi:hypothetical protein